jgi:hypothetical protein
VVKKKEKAKNKNLLRRVFAQKPDAGSSFWGGLKAPLPLSPKVTVAEDQRHLHLSKLLLRLLFLYCDKRHLSLRLATCTLYITKENR